MTYQRSNKVRGRAVVLGQNDSVDKALRKFKKKITESGLLDELRDRQFYEKPTTERKRKAGAARARWLKKLKSQQLPKKLY